MAKLDMDLEEGLLLEGGDTDNAPHLDSASLNEEDGSLGNPEEEDTGHNDGLLHPRAVNFEVCLEVGQINLSLEQIQSLKVGDSLEFIKWPSKVKLRLNRSIFAEGYLVEVNGMLGIKITNKFSN